jgi:hypothetical protein
MKIITRQTHNVPQPVHQHHQFWNGQSYRSNLMDLLSAITPKAVLFLGKMEAQKK